MTIIVRTDEDAVALTALTRSYNIGSSLTVMNNTEFTFPVWKDGGVTSIKPNEIVEVTG